MTADDMNETDKLTSIVAKCQAGSEEGFTELVDMFSASCFGYFYRLTGNREISNDLLSELFIRLVQKIGSFKGGSFKSWLFRVASNIFYDYLRDKQRQKRLFEGKAEHLDGASEEVGRQLEMQDELQAGLSKLDDDTVDLLMMRYYSGMSFKELSAHRGEPIGTTLAKVRRALIKLREIMVKENE
jgi:RNA polymerase sigma-70 factor (ECF subfamily)